MAKMSLDFHNDLEKLDLGLASVDSRVDSMSLPEGVGDFFKELLIAARLEWADDVWRLFDENKELRLLTVGWWFINFTFRVKHCGAFVRAIAGERPYMLPEEPRS